MPFNFQGIATCNDQGVKFVDFRNNEVDVMIIDADINLPDTGTLVQKQITMEPGLIADDLSKYWNEFWQRDNANEVIDETQWTQFQKVIQETPDLPQLSLDTEQIDAWMEVIKNCKSNSAKEVDVWFMDEIKMLPKEVIKACFRTERHASDYNSHGKNRKP